MFPVNVSVPLPLMVRPPAPPMTLATLTLLPFRSNTPVLVIVTPRALGEVIAPPACKVPPVNINVLVTLPSPIASVEFAFSVPAAIVVAPL